MSFKWFKKKDGDTKIFPGKIKLTKKKIISLVLVLVLVVASFFAYSNFWGNEEQKTGPLTALAQVGEVSSVIEGSGTIEAIEQYEITSLIKGEVVEDYFEEGDMVEKDSVLYRMDDEAGYDSVDSAKDSLARAERNYNNAVDDVNNLVVKSKTQGTVTNVYVEVGDSVGANAKIADVTDDSNMILEIQFLEEYANNMVSGVSAADVVLNKNGTVLYGTVTKISTGSVVSSVGAKVKNVEITVPNPGAIKSGDYATAQVGSYSCSSEGTFKNAGKGTIYAETSGKVEKLNIMKGDKVSYGQTAAILSSDNSDTLDNSRDNLTDARKKYNDALEAMEDYTVKAPISGKIIQKNIKAGEKLDNNASAVMAIIADLSSLVFNMSVDELDISKLEVGMDVEVTADAIENISFMAKVSNISIVGTSNNGVTSYPVKVTLNPKEEQTGLAYDNYDKLIPGMNVSANVVIERVENIIVVPVSAVNRGNIVIVSNDSKSEGIGSQMPNMPDGAMVKSDAAPAFDGMEAPAGTASGSAKPNGSSETNNKDSSQKQSDRLEQMIAALDIPNGYKAIVVETGLSDESFIEIKRGLSEGDKVLLPDTTEANETTGMMGAMGGMPGGMGGMPGGMGGGMPSGMGGGMPSGSGSRPSGAPSGMGAR